VHSVIGSHQNRGADKSLVRPTSRCILFDGKNISFDARLVIQDDSGGICETSGNDSMCDSKQKSSYKHVSNFRRLRIYGHFLIPVHALM